MIWNKCKKYWKRGWLPAMVIAGACIYLLNLSWLKWGDLVIDTGKELYVPWKLLSGNMPYRDIVYEYGPFSPYFNAFLCKIFGVHINSFIISGLLTVTALCILLYKISRIFLNTAFSTFFVITFLFVLAFGHYYYAGIFNYIIPYSYASTHSITLAMAALFFYYRDLTRKKKGYLYLCVLFTMLTLITRVEVGAALTVSIFLGIILDFKKQDNLKKRFKMIGTHCIFPLFLAGLIYGFFVILAALDSTGIKDLFSRNIQLVFLNLNLKFRFTNKLIGTNDLYGNIIMMLNIVLYYLGISAVFFAGGWILFLARKSTLVKKSLITIGIILFVASVTILFQNRFISYNMQYRCVPIICIALSVIAYRKYLRGAGERKPLFLTVFSIFSLMLLLRMLFNVWAGHYGFYLLVPGMLCYYIFFLKIIPEKLKKIQIQNLYRFGFIMVAILFIISHTAISFYMYKNRTLEISSPRGSMRVLPAYYRYKQLLGYIREKIGPSEHLLVFPEGLTLNFFSMREYPMYQTSFLPPDFVDNPDFEKELIKSIEDKAITYVVILTRDTSEFGPARFGIDYAQDLMRYLASHYVIEQQFGPWPYTARELGFVLLKRKS